MAERLPSGGQIGEFAPSDYSALQCAVKSLKVGCQELGSLISEFVADRLLDVVYGSYVRA